MSEVSVAIREMVREDIANYLTVTMYISDSAAFAHAEKLVEMAEALVRGVETR